MKSTIKRNLLVGFSLSLFLLIISSVASYNSIQNMLTSSRWVSHTDSVISQLQDVLSTLKDAETGQRGFLLTGEEKFLEPYNGGYEKALLALDEVKFITSDNPTQQESCRELRSAITQRLKSLDVLIQMKRAGQNPTVTQLELGKQYMDEARELIRTMEGRERILLSIRTSQLNKFASVTPILILVAAALSIIITIVFFTRVSNDIEKRAQLQKELEKKDADITRRIDIIQDIASRISSGDYSIRVNDAQRDGLGSLAEALNKMAESLDKSFALISNKEWLQAGLVGLNERMIGELEINTLTENIINFVADYTQSQAAALYIMENDVLQLYSGYAFDKAKERKYITPGQGLVGEAAISGKEILIHDIPADSIAITYATGLLKPKAIIVIPIKHENTVKGVIELATIHDYNDLKLEYIKSIATISGIAINAAQVRKRLQELLEETQAQSEELQAQQRELENLNSELEQQTESLQASEEELKVQQEELQQANEELEERSRVLEEKNQLIVERNLEIQKKSEELALSTKYKSEFLANMSHELRTPLNSILLLSRLLSENNDSNLNDEQVASAKVIQSSGGGLLSLIDEILDLSKIEAGKMDVEFERIPVADISDDMRSLFAPIAREKNLDLVMSTDGRLSSIETDKMRLEQILKNLLSNALKFTTRGSVSLIAEQLNEETASFKVKDTGIGIPAEKHGLIFEAFQQADGSTRRKYGGTGLGLSISRELARLLGGDITLNSEAGKGSEFIVTIPISRVPPAAEYAPYTILEEEQPDINIEENEERKRAAYIAPVIPESIPDDRNEIGKNDKVVLIVEDDTNFAASLLTFTRRKGYKGVVLVRGDEALPAAIKYKPIGVLLDIQLPVKDGWAVMDELKSEPRTRHIPVHIMSSLNAEKESLRSGAVDFINKPLALEQMQQMFEKLEDALTRFPKKVLIVEENPKHAEALAYFLGSFNVKAEIRNDVNASISSLQKKDTDCVILDMGVPDRNAYETLEAVKKTPGLEKLPIIIFTGKFLSRSEESRIKQYADSIVVKTAHSYQRILDEVGLFLHLVEGKDTGTQQSADRYKKLGALDEVLQHKKVLIADDDVRNIFSLSRALEQHGMKIYSATDGKEALQMIKDNPSIDVVLMDIMMPEMDGYESIRKIRQIPKFKRLPILAVTAKAMMGDREKCIAAGASDYISKPVDVDQLLSLLRVWLYNETRPTA